MIISPTKHVQKADIYQFGALMVGGDFMIFPPMRNQKNWNIQNQ